MAKYVTTIESPMSPDAAFAYMADLRNFEEWDPGVQRSEQVEGASIGPDAVYDVTVDAPGKGLTLRYRTVEYDAPRSVTVEAKSTVFTSLDRITVEPSGDGSLVTYDAELTLNGPLGLFDVALKPTFRKIGGRANEGLLRVLDGTQR